LIQALSNTKLAQTEIQVIDLPDLAGEQFTRQNEMGTQNPSSQNFHHVNERD